MSGTRCGSVKCCSDSSASTQGNSCLTHTHTHTHAGHVHTHRACTHTEHAHTQSMHTHTRTYVHVLTYIHAASTHMYTHKHNVHIHAKINIICHSNITLSIVCHFSVTARLVPTCAYRSLCSCSISDLFKVSQNLSCRWSVDYTTSVQQHSSNTVTGHNWLASACCWEPN